MTLLSSCHPSAGPRRFSFFVLVLALPVWSAAGVASTPELVKAMLDNAPAAAEARCSYTRIRLDEDGEETKRERYHAGDAGSPWELVRVDGREPSEQEVRRYARDERDRNHPLAFDLRSMVDAEHWRLRSESETEAVYEFRLQPNEDLDERLVEKVLGTLVVDKVREQPVRITIENTEAAYVAPFVRVAEYIQEMDFRWDDSVGAAVLARTETHMRGRAMGLKVLERHKLVRYSDYQCRPEMADAGD